MLLLWKNKAICRRAIRNDLTGIGAEVGVNHGPQRADLGIGYPLEPNSSAALHDAQNSNLGIPLFSACGAGLPFST